MYDIDRLPRAARRGRRISQRELADLAGIPSSTVARIEAGKIRPRFDTVATLLSAVGYGFVVCDRRGRLLEVDDLRDRLVDRGGRRLPAHLRTDKTPTFVDGRWWGWGRIAWGPDDWVPKYTYWRRRVIPVVGDRSGIHEQWDDAT